MQLVYVIFFFQAEDGIRDWSVTGVQTCALPICLGSGYTRPRPQRRPRGGQSQPILHVRPEPRSPLPRQAISKRRPTRREQIGRASCRERVKMTVGGGGVKERTGQSRTNSAQTSA